MVVLEGVLRTINVLTSVLSGLLASCIVPFVSSCSRTRHPIGGTSLDKQIGPY